MSTRSSQNEMLQALERSNRELQALVEIGKTLTSTLDFREILQQVMEKTCALLHSQDWSLLLKDEQTGELVFELVVSPVAEKLKGMRLQDGEGIAGWVARHGEPLLIPDVQKDERFARKLDDAVSFITQSMVCVPVKSRERVLGVMEMVNSPGAPSFNASDLRILAVIADYVAIAIENARNFERIQQLVITDDLTGLYNSRHFHHLIEYEVARADRNRTPVSLVFIDLDRFKRVNDTFGHLFGSRLLGEVGRLISRQIRTVDLAARYGGDEFVLLLPATDKAGAFVLTSKLRQTLKEHPFVADDGRPVTVTASFGIASFPEDAGNKEELIRKADQVMYQIKESTRDAVRVFAGGGA